MIWWERCNFKIFFTAVMALWSLDAGDAQPVLVELFTSEGCSSCPPADALLRELERSPSIPGVTVIAMSEHVDYWNHLGWSDPFSSAQMSARQQAYATHLGTQGIYTPQMIVDGVYEFTGGNSARAYHSIADASTRPKLELIAHALSRAKLHISAPASRAAADLFVATVYDPDPSAVSRGENSGRHLTHISVVKSLRKVGEIGPKKPFDADVPVSAGAQLPNERLIIFAQERGQGRVLGVAATTPEKP
jgi:hypothetical protein